MAQDLDVSVVLVSFNTRDMLRECLHTVFAQTGVTLEVYAVDNASADGSVEMMRKEFPQVNIIPSAINLGFGAANNVALRRVKGRYTVLLNTDAFLRPGDLALAVRKMDATPKAGLAGARLTGKDGSWQPSARMFPSVLNDMLLLSGLAAKFKDSRFFGRADRTWADQGVEASVDWVPGAFVIVRREVLETVGHFDERFFLYYEEVDLCRRIKNAGWEIWYWPELVVVHIGGESSRQVKRLSMSSRGSQLTLWRMRSALLYYRKHHDGKVWFAMEAERLWHRIRLFRNRFRRDADSVAKCEESLAIVLLYKQAWADTDGGRTSPTRPW
jgi:GT2 family glycosyltransferase